MDSSKRLRQSIKVLGLDTSSPHLTVDDGKCAKLHNLRYANGAWRNVNPLLEKTKLREQEFIDIVYKHPVSDEKEYIVFKDDPNDADSRGLWKMRIMPSINNGQTHLLPYMSLLQHIVHIPSGVDYAISHFGNILILIDKTNKVNRYYYYQNGVYSEYSIPAPVSMHRESVKQINHTQWVEAGNCKLPTMPLYYPTSDTFAFPTVYEDYWWGEICCFAAYQYVDGNVTSPSALNIFSSELDNNQSRNVDEYGAVVDSTKTYYRLNDITIKAFNANGVDDGLDYIRLTGNDSYYGVGGDFGVRGGTSTLLDKAFSIHSFHIKPTIKLKIPDIINLNRKLITSVNIYSTRINPIFDAKKLLAAYNECKDATKDNYLSKNHNYTPTYGGSNRSGAYIHNNRNICQLYADNKLPEQPHYLIKEIPLSDFNDNGECIIELTAELLENAEQKTMYDPVTSHKRYLSSMKEYNSRLHIFGDGLLTIYPGFGDGLLDEIPADAQPADIYVKIIVDDNIHYAKVNVSNDIYDCVGCKKILSYPDYRAKALIQNGNIFTLSPAKTNNFAYHIDSGRLETIKSTGTIEPPTDYKYVKYSNRMIDTIHTDDIFTIDDTICDTNKIIVSAEGNPLVYPLANTYALGQATNKVVAINSAAIEMSDAKFGEFPLYAFTEEGIFALQSGSGEVLYASIIPINYDKIINKSTLAINNSIIYITDRGVHALSSNGNHLLSEPINNSSNDVNVNYLKSVMLLSQKSWNEVLLYNPNDAEHLAYIYSLDGNYWSTRDIKGGKINVDELVYKDSNYITHIFDTNAEALTNATTYTATLETRPIKMQSTEYKKIETFIARITATAELNDINLTVSRCKDDWSTTPIKDVDIASLTKAGIRLVHMPVSAKAFVFAISLPIKVNFNVTGFDVELFNRFVKRIR